MDRKWKLGVYLAFVVIALLVPTTVYAHGVDIYYTSSTVVEIVAAYDTGEPMAGAQVAVYAPDELSTPWLTGVCDEEGRFSFSPDTSKPGTWDVQVRLAGHGDIVHIAVGGGTAASSGGGYSVLQIVLMSLCVVWGLIGTALYVLRRRA
ncbi:MAG: carboxypeptidase regulatory-like domain-containing protein [Chloroflexota bacterium]|nr:carboxypeptidase regulatory-like domain-containing protein [Chloroflexota bacterium]